MELAAADSGVIGTLTGERPAGLAVLLLRAAERVLIPLNGGVSIFTPPFT